MAHGGAVRRAASGLLAVLVAGCGSAASGPSTATHRVTTAVRAPAPATSRGPASAPSPPSAAYPPPVPAGFVRYRAYGFSFLAPAGFKVAPDGGVSGLPPGASLQFLTPGGKRLESTNTQLMVAKNPHLHGDLGSVSTRLEAADANSPSLTHVQSTVSTMTVARAADVRIVKETFIGPGGGRSRTLFQRTWLMVSPRPGVLLDLVVVDEPERGGTLEPATVLDSFQLDPAG